MRSTLILAAMLAAALASPASAASLELRRLAGQVTIIPEDRADIAVTVVRAGPGPRPRVFTRPGGVTVIDRGPATPWLPFIGLTFIACPGLWSLDAGVAPRDRLSQIVVRTPRQVRVSSSGAVRGFIGRADAVDLSVYGCDRWTVADVRGDLKVRDTGAATIRAGSAGQATADVIGSGDIFLGDAAGGLAATITGSGDVRARSASGLVRATIAGDGDIVVSGGHASSLKASIGGSGDIRYLGVSDALDAAITGSGDMTVTRVNGPVNKTVTGAGEIRIGP